MDEDGPNFGGIVGRIEEGVFSDKGVIAAEQCATVAPPTTADDGAGLVFSDKVALVGDELGIDSECGTKGTIDLRGRIVACLKTANGLLNELTQGWNVRGESNAEPDLFDGGHGCFCWGV
jgi:hypothetical protein